MSTTTLTRPAPVPVPTPPAATSLAPATPGPALPATHPLPEPLPVPTPPKSATPAAGIDIIPYAAGKRTETWRQWDALGFMQQVGAMPPPRQSGRSFALNMHTDRVPHRVRPNP